MNDNNIGKLELGLYPPGYNARAVAYVHAHVKGLGPSQMMTLLAIAQHMNDRLGTARVSRERIRQLAGLKSLGTVDRSMGPLVKMGHLVKHAKSGPHGENVYSLPCLTYLAPVLDAEEIHAQEMRDGDALLQSRSRAREPGGSKIGPVLFPNNSIDNQRNDLSYRDSMGPKIGPPAYVSSSGSAGISIDSSLAQFRALLDEQMPWVVALSELFADTLISNGRKAAAFRDDAYSGEWLEAFERITFELDLHRDPEFFGSSWRDRPKRDANPDAWNQITGESIAAYLQPVFDYVADPPPDAPKWVQHANRPRELHRVMPQLLDIVRPIRPPAEVPVEQVQRPDPYERLEELLG